MKRTFGPRQLLRVRTLEDLIRDSNSKVSMFDKITNFYSESCGSDIRINDTMNRSFGREIEVQEIVSDAEGRVDRTGYYRDCSTGYVYPPEMFEDMGYQNTECCRFQGHLLYCKCEVDK